LPFDIIPLADPRPAAAGRRLAWLASGDEGVPLGSAFLRLCTKEGQEHLAELRLAVHGAERRRGVGTRLLEAAVDAARTERRRSVIAQAEQGSPADLFLAAGVSGRSWRSRTPCSRWPTSIVPRSTRSSNGRTPATG
jgi:GNAT superfamily N-acetyltransferase